jgi:undecaprenyl diphosphate synthase
MNQSALQPGSPSSLHVAIIMDGSGRWALGRGKPRSEGHRAGVRAVRRAIEAAPRLGVGTLTLHAFSSQNWQRPQAEVRGLFGIFQNFLRAEVPGWLAAGVRISVFGRRDRLPRALVRAIESAEAATAGGRGLHLRLAIDYSAREEILGAAKRLNTDAKEDEFVRALAPETESPDVDLLIRTGGELRLSDFMLWECAYAELYFTPRLWPDFTSEDLEAALSEFHSRDRRFGRIPESVAV